MEDWKEEQINELCNCDDEKVFFDALILQAIDLGFDYCAYGTRFPFPLSRPHIITFSNYPEEWQVRYNDKSYISADPTVLHAFHSLHPIRWSDKLFSSTPELWEEAKSFGLRVGWAQPYRNEHGTIGLLTIARTHEPISDSELRQKREKLAWFAQVAHLGMSQCLTKNLLPEAVVYLTAKEREVLQWTADGKTSGEISDILGLSERTVNFHIGNTITKFGVSNKVAAAVRATALGLLY